MNDSVKASRTTNSYNLAYPQVALGKDASSKTLPQEASFPLKKLAEDTGAEYYGPGRRLKDRFTTPRP